MPQRLPSGVDAAVVMSSSAWGRAHLDARRLAARMDRGKMLAGILRAADASLIILLSVVAHSFRYGFTPVPADIAAIAMIAAIATTQMIALSGAYGDGRKFDVAEQVRQASRAWTITFVCIAAAGYFFHVLEGYSRLWVAAWYLSVLSSLTLVRLAASVLVRRWQREGALASIMAVVDFTADGHSVFRALGKQSSAVKLLGIFSPDQQGGAGIDELLALSRQFRIDDVLVLVNESIMRQRAEDVSLALCRLGTIPANICISGLLPTLDNIPIRSVELVHGIPALTVHRCPVRSWSGVVKRMEDLFVGGLALIMTLPVMAVVAIAIKLDSPGPILFRQARHGFNNNIIQVLKFRTMRHDTRVDVAVRQATRNDSRVTRVGRFLRRTSLDELPQIFNVLRGEMALVGPRPHAVVHNEQYAALIANYAGRHRVQPGITGWAQVNGLRGETDTLEKMQRRLEHDLYYIEHWNIGLDLKILFRTVTSTMFDQNAY